LGGIVKTIYRSAAVLAALIGLAACATNPIPEGYTGPRATISDTATSLGSSSADLFVLSKVDGKMIHESITGTRQANYGRGFYMAPVAVNREVPAQPAKYTIVGRRVYAAPILELVNKIYEITGELEFTPEADGSYVVKGKLGDDYSAVWLENARTGDLVGRKFETNGSTALGILQK
jgi:hypothetical protein